LQNILHCFMRMVNTWNSSTCYAVKNSFSIFMIIFQH